MAWKPGPLPPDTWNWGGVCLVGESQLGFYFADFCGSHAKIFPDGRIVWPAEIALWCNCLELPPNVTHRQQA